MRWDVIYIVYMAKIPSNASPINFGSNDTLAGIKQLGSTVKEGTPVTSTNITTLLENVIDGLYANNVDAGGSAKLPIAGELNGLFYSVFGLLAHIQQNGIQEYNANIEYPAFALAKSVDGEALYQSKVNLNKGNALTDTTKWLSLCNISDLQYLLQATNTTRGTSRFATDAEALAGALNNVALTPLNLKNTTWNPVFVGYTPSNITISSQETYVKFNFSQIATNDNSWYNASNGRFTPTSSGWYQINFTTYGQSNGTSAYYDKNGIFKNGNIFAESERNSFAGGISINNQYVLLMYFNGTTDYIETFVSFGGSNGTSMTFAGNTQSTQLQIIRLRS